MKILFLFLGLGAFQLGHAQTMKLYADSAYKYQIQYPAADSVMQRFKLQ
jgi:hypothetical protein